MHILSGPDDSRMGKEANKKETASNIIKKCNEASYKEKVYKS